MPQIAANGIQLEYETHGDPANPPLLLIMGLGAQLTLWPIEFVDALVARGYHVIRYDNRDIGLSQKFGEHTPPHIYRIALMRMVGLRPQLPYRLSDMANDAAGLLDALGIGQAHVVGASLGGMIAQLLAVNHGHRVLSLTSVMSSTGNPRMPRAKPAAMEAMMNRLPADASLEQVIPHGIRLARTIGSPGYPAAEERLVARITANYHRSIYPTGAARQLAAAVDDWDRRKRLRRIAAPTLVIHGVDDPLIPVECGRDTAAHIPGARLLEIPGMGHDLPLALVEQLADAVAGVAQA